MNNSNDTKMRKYFEQTENEYVEGMQTEDMDESVLGMERVETKNKMIVLRKCSQYKLRTSVGVFRK